MTGLSGLESAGRKRASAMKQRAALRLYATRLLNAGMDITRIQKLLGHQYLNTTLIYARVSDSTVEADYRRAMRAIEHQQMPLATTPIPVVQPPFSATSEREHIVKELILDNSV